MLLEKSSVEEDSSLGSCCELAVDQIQSEIFGRNTEKVENIVLAAMQYGVGLRAAAAIATVAWIDAGIITQGSTYLAIDHNKIKQAQEKLMKSATKEFRRFVSTAKIDCIF